MYPRFNPDLPFVKADYEGVPLKDGRYTNEHPHPFPGFGDILRWQLGSNPQKQEKKTDDFRVPTQSDHSFFDTQEDIVVWLGHASFFIRFQGVNFITDPCLRDLPMIPRLAKLPFGTDQIRNIDYILMSHGHRDHFDVDSLKLILKNNPKAEFLAPLRLGKLIRALGHKLYQEAGWYQSFQGTRELDIHFLPAKHWNRRFLTDTNTMLWGSFYLSNGSKNLYFAGDSGYASHFADIGELYPDLDLCLMPVGAYKPSFIMEHSHTSPTEAVQAFHDLGGKRFIPMHYGTYDLSDEPIGEPVRILRKLQKEQQIKGEYLELGLGEAYSW